PMTPPLVLDTNAPLPPSTPDLIPADDTGLSNTDNITKKTTPTFTGTAEPNSVVQLFVNGVGKDTGLASATGAYSIQLTQPLADGTYTIQAAGTDVAGNTSPLSSPLTPPLVIDTTAPTPPTVPDLIPADDTGLSHSYNYPSDRTTP